MEGSKGQGQKTVRHRGQTKESRVTATWAQALAPGWVTWDSDSPPSLPVLMGKVGPTESHHVVTARTK